MIGWNDYKVHWFRGVLFWGVWGFFDVWFDGVVFGVEVRWMVEVFVK